MKTSLVKQSDVCDLLIFTLMFSKHHFESVKLFVIKHDKNKYINIAPISDNKISRKMIISIKFSKM